MLERVRERFGAIGRRSRLVPGAFQHRAQQIGALVVVVNDEDVHARDLGAADAGGGCRAGGGRRTPHGSYRGGRVPPKRKPASFVARMPSSTPSSHASKTIQPAS